ncbi:hypothetical protein ACFL02_08950 [Planctomycetota bacterium]
MRHTNILAFFILSVMHMGWLGNVNIISKTYAQTENITSLSNFKTPQQQISIWRSTSTKEIPIQEKNLNSRKTIREVLAYFNIDSTHVPVPDPNIPLISRVIIDNEKVFFMVYYPDDSTNSLGDYLHLIALRKDQNTWFHKIFEVDEMLKDKPYYDTGTILRAVYSDNYFYVITHLSPSACFTLIFSQDFNYLDALYGWMLAYFDDGAVVYQNSQVHFAPTHYTEISIYDPHSKTSRKIHPIKPYQNIRLAHIQKVAATYERLGLDWFARNNHHMNPELFNNGLASEVAVNNQTKSLAFVIAFDNKDYWTEEQRRSPDTISLPEYTKVAYIYKNIKQEPIEYKEILLSDLQLKYGDKALSQCLGPDQLKDIFMNTSLVLKNLTQICVAGILLLIYI